MAAKRGRENDNTQTPDVPEPELEEAFDRLVEEGEIRLKRSTLALLTTGLIGGLDVGFGVLAYLVVEHVTHNVVLAGLGFSLGFVALLLGRSELFTENFLVPVMTLVAGKSGPLALARLWGLTLVTNLAGGWIIGWLIITARPDLKTTAIEVGSHYAELGVSLQSFTLAVLAGAVITLMTRMQHATDNLGVQLVPGILFSALLAAGQLFHCVLDSLFMFAALVSGAPFGYLDWLGAFGWAALGNLVGGIGLVTAIRVLQVPHRVAESRDEDN
ncbi:MAG: formate-nitrite transporter family protein [Pseudonocardiales bacterium]|nr:formate-nitrite transporter family protein [Pseudonocardiales bacterium]